MSGIFRSDKVEGSSARIRRLDGDVTRLVISSVCVVLG